jgi:hypothetical protein
MKKILILALFITGCTAEKQLAKISVKRPELLAKTCGNFFPIKESVTREIQYVQGQRDTLWQSEFVDCDTIYGQDRVIRVPYIVKIRDTFKMVEVRTEENTAQIESLGYNISELEAMCVKKDEQLLDTKQALKNTRGVLSILTVILATIGVFLYVKSRLKWI